MSEQDTAPAGEDEREREKAIKVAERVLRAEGLYSPSAVILARALLSSPRVERERALEEAAAVADLYVVYGPANEEAARAIANAIRSLSPTDGAPANPPKVRTP